MSKVVWYSHLFKNFPWFVLSHTIKGFSIVSEAEINLSLELLPCFLHDPVNVGNLIPGSFTFYKPSLKKEALGSHIAKA